MSCADFVRKLDIRKQVRILRKEEESFLAISEQRETPQFFKLRCFVVPAIGFEPMTLRV